MYDFTAPGGISDLIGSLKILRKHSHRFFELSYFVCNISISSDSSRPPDVRPSALDFLTFLMCMLDLSRPSDARPSAFDFSTFPMRMLDLSTKSAIFALQPEEWGLPLSSPALAAGTGLGSLSSVVAPSSRRLQSSAYPFVAQSSLTHDESNTTTPILLL